MAKFTSTAPLNIRWLGNDLAGPAGTVHRIPDALYEEFEAAFGGLIPGLTWTDTDETDGFATIPLAQTDVTGLTAALAAKADTSSLSAYVPKSGATMTGPLTGPAFGATGRPHFDARAYGAVGDGSTVDDPAIQLAVDAASAAGGGVVYIPAGTYRFTDEVDVPSNVTIRGEGAATIIRNDHTGYAFYAAGSLGSLINIASNVARGASTVVLAASASAFASGDILWVQSEAQPLELASSKNAEIATVSSATGSTITVIGRVLSIYNTSDSAKAAEITPVRNVHIRDLAIFNVGYSATTVSTNPLIAFDFGVNVSVRGCHLYQNNAAGVMFRNCLKWRAADNLIEDLRDDEGNDIYGYGVLASHASRLGVVTGNTIRRCRHGFTNSTSAAGPTPNYGVARTLSIVGNSFGDCSHFAIDTHEDARGVVISGNAVNGGSGGGGIQVRSYDNSITGNIIGNLPGRGMYLRPQSQENVVLGNTIGNIFTEGGSAGIGIHVDTPNSVISSNNIHDCDGDGIYYGSNANVMHTLIGNLIQSNGGDGIQLDDAMERFAIVGNVVALNGIYGLRLESAMTNEDRITLVGNVIANNTTADYSNAGSAIPISFANGAGGTPGFIQRKIFSNIATVNAGVETSVVLTFDQAFLDTDYAVYLAFVHGTTSAGTWTYVIKAKSTTSITLQIKNNDVSNRALSVDVLAVHT